MHHEGSRRIFPMSRLPEFSEVRFGELRTAEVRRTLLPRTRVNKGKKRKGRGYLENPNPRWVLVISQPVLRMIACIWS